MLWFLLRASRAVACQVLAATLAFVQLWLHPLLCGVNSRAAIIAGNHLHALLHSERRAKHPFRLALRPPDWPTCGDVNTHSPVSQEDGIRPAGGSNYLSHDWKWGETPAVVSPHISTQETDRRTLFPVDSPSHTHTHTHIYTLPCRAQAYLCTCSVNLEVPAGSWCVDVCVWGLSETFSVVFECHKPKHV